MTASLLRGHFRKRWRAGACLFAAIVLTEAVYLRPAILTGKQALAGSDYEQLHMARLAFAEDGLFGPRHTLPAWYPRELLGSPFAANLQSFPWIPTRLVLLLFPPEIAYAPGVAMAAFLAVVFTYLFCRRAGLSAVAAAASGWTFACAGFFASRILAGHLPLLEAYPGLPLLLWLADRALDPERASRHRWDVGWLAIASACLVLAGHPQIPAYAMAAALLYVIWRGRGWLRARLAGALILGSSLALAAWWPMLLLIRKSTRVLDLDPPDNDIVFPYRRIWSLFAPGSDGWPSGFTGHAAHAFSGYPNLAYFYDTASYIGLAPIVAVAALLLLCCFRKRLPASRFLFLAVVGSVAFLGALPLLDFLRELSPALILRSPARLLYLTTFSLAVALGAAVDAVLAMRAGGKLLYAAVAVGLGLHGMDLAGFSRQFVRTIPPSADLLGAQDQVLARTVQDGRMATDFSLWSSRRRFDDIGAFDSLLLAKPYRALLALSGASPRLNLQVVNGATLARPALRAGSAILVLTPHIRPDLLLVGGRRGLNVYSVPDPAPRASFYGAQSVAFLPEDQIPAWLRSHGYVKELLLMPEASRNPAPVTPAVPGANSARDGAVIYKRPSTDEIRLDVLAGNSGFVNVVEAYDPGWSAQVDGRPAPVFAANSFTLGTPVSAGKHIVRFLYRTPGRTLGVALSLTAMSLLAWLIWFSQSAPSMGLPRAPAPARPVPPSGSRTGDAQRQRRQRRRRFGK
jgi:hypothetical protein